MFPGLLSRWSHKSLAAATVINVDTDIVFLTGVSPIETINVPNSNFATVIGIIPVDLNIVIGVTGNILVGAVAAQNRLTLLVWNPILQKWHVGAIS